MLADKALGHLDDEPARVQAGLGEHPPDLIDEVVTAQLPRRDVDM